MDVCTRPQEISLTNHCRNITSKLKWNQLTFSGSEHVINTFVPWLRCISADKEVFELQFRMACKRNVIFAKATECKKSWVINVKHVATTLFYVHLLVLNSITQLEKKQTINLCKLYINFRLCCIIEVNSDVFREKFFLKKNYFSKIPR